MNEGLSECVREWVSEWVDEGVSGWARECLRACVGGRGGRANEWIIKSLSEVVHD